MAYDVQKFLTGQVASANGSSVVLAPIEQQSIAVGVNVTASSGTTPTLDLRIEWSFDGTTWATAEVPTNFAQITGVKNTVQIARVHAPYFRLTWTVGGTTPSFTFDAWAYFL